MAELVAMLFGGGGVAMLGWFAYEIRRQAVRDRQRAAQDEAWLAEIRARYEQLHAQAASASRAMLVDADAGTRAWDRATGWVAFQGPAPTVVVSRQGEPADDASFLRSLGIAPEEP